MIQFPNAPLLNTPGFRRGLAWWVFIVCMALQTYSIWQMSLAPRLGARLQREGEVVCIADLVSGSPLAQAGIREGDRLKTVEGRPCEASAFESDPDDLPTWDQRASFFEWQQFLSAHPDRLHLELETSR